MSQLWGALGHPEGSGLYQAHGHASFHNLEQRIDEVRGAGFDAVSLHAAKGPGWLMQEHWSDPDRREQMLFAARAVESEPSLSGLSAHLLAVGTKPGVGQSG
jgi:hypothetical protein